MNALTVLDFEWILLSAALAGILSVKLKMPPVVGLLFVGMIIGPNILNLIGSSTIEILAELGAVLMLFMIGIEFSITKLLATGLRAIISSLLLVLLTFAVMHEVSILLGFDYLTSLFIASLFSMSSTAIMMKILEQKRLIESREVPILVAMLIVEDLIAIFMLTSFSSLKSGSLGDGLAGAVLVAFAVMVFAYFILLRLLKKFSSMFLKYSADDTLILFAFTLGIGMSFLASFLGLTPSIGAFLAGSIIAGLPIGRDVEASMRPFSHVFSSFFFLSVGMLINPATIIASADITLVLICGFMVTVFLATTFTFFLVSSSGRSSIFAGLAMLPLGEFSLLIAKESSGLVPIDLIGIASVGVLFSSLVCSISLNHSYRIYVGLKKVLPSQFLATLRDASGYFRNVVCAFEPGGYFHSLFVSEFKKSASDMFYLICAVVFYLAAKPLLQFEIVAFEISFHASILLLAVLAILCLLPIYRLLRSMKRLFDALSTIFSRTTPKTNRGFIIRNIGIASALFFLFVNSYLIVDLLLLPKIFNWVALVFGILAVFFFWSALRASSLWLFLRENKPFDLLKSKIVASKDDFILVAEPKPKDKNAKNKKQNKTGGPRKTIFLR